MMLRSMKLKLLILVYLFPLIPSQGNGHNATVCSNGDVRLVDGTNQYEGRVELCYNEQWWTVCANQWGPEEAATVCKQLNLTLNGKGIPVHEAFFGQGLSTIFLDNVRCGENQTRLMNCNRNPIGENICFFYKVVGVICRGSSNCTDGEVRLEGGEDEWEGRVEICFDGVWGTVCDTNWDDENARTVCRQLIGDRGSIHLNFDEGKGPIFLNEVNCTASHRRLIDCQKSTNIRECFHIQDAGVICQVVQKNTTSVNRKSLTPYTEENLVLISTASVAAGQDQFLTPPGSQSTTLTIVEESQETVIIQRTSTSVLWSTLSKDVDGLETMQVEPYPSHSTKPDETITIQVTTRTIDEQATSTTPVLLIQPTMTIVAGEGNLRTSETTVYFTTITLTPEKFEENSTTLSRIFQDSITATVASDGQANITSSPLYVPILGSIGAVLLVLFLLVVLGLGIFVILRRKRKNTYEIQEHSSFAGTTAIDNPVYSSNHYSVGAIKTTDNGVHVEKTAQAFCSTTSQNEPAIEGKHTHQIQEYSSITGATALDNPVYSSTDYSPAAMKTTEYVLEETVQPFGRTSLQNGSANVVNQVVYESLKRSPNYQQEELYEAPQLALVEVINMEANTTERQH